MARNNAYKFLMVFIVMFAFVNIYLQGLSSRINNILDRVDKLSTRVGAISSKTDYLLVKTIELSVKTNGLSETTRNLSTMTSDYSVLTSYLSKRTNKLLHRTANLSEMTNGLSQKTRNLSSETKELLDKTNLMLPVKVTNTTRYINTQRYLKPKTLDKTNKQSAYRGPNVDDASFDDYLIKHPLFSKFNLKISPNKTRVNLVVIITSAPKRSDRRQAIRDTWWQQCKSNDRIKVECFFMTDRQSPGSRYHKALQKESKQYGDLRFQNLKGGLDFYLRYMYHVVYAFLNYQFDYILRMDDDYFFCMEKFLGEVPIPMQREFHWGWVHCVEESLRADESITVFSRDVLKKLFSQNPEKMRCSLTADLTIGIWVQDLNIQNLFRHDNRLHHHPPVAEQPELRLTKNVCSSYIGIHGSYPADMRLFWTNRGTDVSSTGTLLTNSYVCPAKSFLYYSLPEPWNIEPKLCLSDPKWESKLSLQEDGSYNGREEELASQYAEPSSRVSANSTKVHENLPQGNISRINDSQQNQIQKYILNRENIQKNQNNNNSSEGEKFVSLVKRLKQKHLLAKQKNLPNQQENIPVQQENIPE